MFFKPTNILSFLFIILCVYGGSGFHSENYCCDDCREVGIDAVLTDECHKVHETECGVDCSETGQENADCLHQCINKGMCCSITVYTLDDYVADNKSQINVPTFDLPYPLQHLFDKELIASSGQECSDTYFLPAYFSRDRQVFYSTFLI